MSDTTEEQVALAKLKELGWTPVDAPKSRQKVGITRCVIRRVGGSDQMIDGVTWVEVLGKAQQLGPA